MLQLKNLKPISFIKSTYIKPKYFSIKNLSIIEKTIKAEYLNSNYISLYQFFKNVFDKRSYQNINKLCNIDNIKIKLNKLQINEGNAFKSNDENANEEAVSPKKRVIKTDMDVNGKRLKVGPENSEKFKDFEVFSNYNSLWVESYLNQKLPLLSKNNEERLIAEINRFLSIDNNFIPSDDLMSKEEIYEGVRERFLSNHRAFNKICNVLKASEIDANQKMNFDLTAMDEFLEDSDVESLNVFFSGVLKRKFDSYNASGYVPTTKVTSDLKVELISISKFSQNLSRFTPWGGPRNLINSLIGHYRKQNKPQLSESTNILKGDFLIPRFLITFDEQLMLIDKVESDVSKIVGIFERKAIVDFIVVGNDEGFSFREHTINSRYSNINEKNFEL